MALPNIIGSTAAATAPVSCGSVVQCSTVPRRVLMIHCVLCGRQRRLTIETLPRAGALFYIVITSNPSSQHIQMATAVNNLLGLGLAPRVAPGAPRAHPAPAPSPRCSFKPTQRCSPRRAAVVVASAAPGSSAAARQPSAPHVQLATARLPADVDVATFNRHLYQWAATLTTNGRNLPFSLPLKADPRDDGFQVPGGLALAACVLLNVLYCRRHQQSILLLMVCNCYSSMLACQLTLAARSAHLPPSSHPLLTLRPPLLNPHPTRSRCCGWPMVETWCLWLTLWHR